MEDRTMTAKERLIGTLFRKSSDRLLNIKFFRGNASDISPEDLCREANTALLHSEIGLIKPQADFGDRDRPVFDVKLFSSRT